jgi:hypothetical protein
MLQRLTCSRTATVVCMVSSVHYWSVEGWVGDGCDGVPQRIWFGREDRAVSLEEGHARLHPPVRREAHAQLAHRRR